MFQYLERDQFSILLSILRDPLPIPCPDCTRLVTPCKGVSVTRRYVLRAVLSSSGLPRGSDHKSESCVSQWRRAGCPHSCPPPSDHSPLPCLPSSFTRPVFTAPVPFAQPSDAHAETPRAPSSPSSGPFFCPRPPSPFFLHLLLLLVVSLSSVAFTARHPSLTCFTLILPTCLHTLATDSRHCRPLRSAHRYAQPTVTLELVHPGFTLRETTSPVQSQPRPPPRPRTASALASPAPPSLPCLPPP